MQYLDHEDFVRGYTQLFQKDIKIMSLFVLFHSFITPTVKQA